MENQNKKLWPIATFWIISVIAVAIGLDTKFSTSTLKCKSFAFCTLPSLAGKFLGAAVLGIILSGIVCLIIKKWRNAYSFLLGALIINAVFFVVFIIG